MIDQRAELGLLVKLCREDRGLTQEQLANELGLPRTPVAHLEQGYRLPEAGVLRRICRYLELPEVLWRGFAPGDSTYATAVRCHCRTYYTKWTSASAEEKRRSSLVYAVKNGKPWRDGKQKFDDPYLMCARKLRKTFPKLFLNRTFVPVPSSRASQGLKDEAWASLRLADAYAAEGIGCRVLRLLRRSSAIRKSSDPKATGPRPTVVEHLTTLKAAEGEAPPGLVLVDDVATRGTTLVACANRLLEQGWRGQVDALVVAYARAPNEDSPKDGHELTFVWDGEWDYPAREG